MHDERLQPHAQSYEFTPQPHHHQEDYGYNPQFVSVSEEDFIRNLINTNLQTLEFAYAYIQSMHIPLFAYFHQSIANSSSTNDFVQKEQPIVPDEQLQPQEHGRVRRQPACYFSPYDLTSCCLF